MPAGGPERGVEERNRPVYFFPPMGMMWIFFSAMPGTTIMESYRIKSAAPSMGPVAAGAERPVFRSSLRMASGFLSLDQSL